MATRLLMMLNMQYGYGEWVNPNALPPGEMSLYAAGNQSGHPAASTQ